MRREWTNGNFRKRAFAYSRLFLVAMTLCSSVTQAYCQDSIDTYFTHQTLSVNKTIEEPHIDCPQPLVVITFLYKQICVHVCLGEKLAVANALLEQQGFTQVSQLGVQRLTGFRPGQASLHGQGMAIDIDAAANPYIIHERHESKIDEELAVVYERIAQFMLGRSSIIPLLGEERQTKEARHAYVAQFYDALSHESVAMQRYFALMQDGKRLQEYVHTIPGAQRVRLPTTFLSILSAYDLQSIQTPSVSAPLSDALIDQLRRQMMSDWITLTGNIGPPILSLDHAVASLHSKNVYLRYPPILPPDPEDPATGKADRPFDPKGSSYPGRSPLKGFLTLRKDVVLALIDAGLRWGALDFGRTSGDIMHFDSRDTKCDKIGTPNP
jgi:hypothetical protein